MANGLNGRRWTQIMTQFYCICQKQIKIVANQRDYQTIFRSGISRLSKISLEWFDDCKIYRTSDWRRISSAEPIKQFFEHFCECLCVITSHFFSWVLLVMSLNVKCMWQPEQVKENKLTQKKTVLKTRKSCKNQIKSASVCERKTKIYSFENGTLWMRGKNFSEKKQTFATIDTHPWVDTKSQNSKKWTQKKTNGKNCQTKWINYV